MASRLRRAKFVALRALLPYNGEKQAQTQEDKTVQNVYPDHYPQFRCAAGRCRHNCCIGWEIDVDEASLARYRALSGAMGTRLEHNIAVDGDAPHFILGEDERCPFLNADNLCDLILFGGEGMLCQICTDHPRFRSFFEDRTEIGVGLCCEEAARLILTKRTPTYLITEGEGTLTADERALLSLRDRLFAAAQARETPLHARMEEILSLCGAALPDASPADWAAFYLSLERMDERWTEILTSLRVQGGALLLDAFAAHMAPRMTEYEQLLVYFLYRHLPAALDDSDAPGKAAFAVLSVRLLFALGALHYEKTGSFTVDDQIELCRLYSAEVEYSDENLFALYDALA